jgi:hypothetical protein
MWFFSLAKGLYFLVGKLRWAVWGRGEGRSGHARERDSLLLRRAGAGSRAAGSVAVQCAAR